MKRLTSSRSGPPGPSSINRWPRHHHHRRKVTDKVSGGPIINGNPFGFQRLPATLPAMQSKLTERRKRVFLAELARHGIIVRAARAASPRASSQYGAVRTFKDERDRDEEFARQWEEAMESAKADVEHELYRRAQEGYSEPIYGGRYKEQVVGYVTKYSDRLLELRAKALLPAYREISSVSVNGRVTHNLDAGVLGDAVAKVALQMAEGLRSLPPPVRVIENEPR